MKHILLALAILALPATALAQKQTETVDKTLPGDQRLKTFSGDIEVDATFQGSSPNPDLETFSGTRSSGRRNIRAELPGGAGSTLRFKSFSGTLRLVK